MLVRSGSTPGLPMFPQTPTPQARGISGLILPNGWICSINALLLYGLLLDQAHLFHLVYKVTFLITKMTVQRLDHIMNGTLVPFTMINGMTLPSMLNGQKIRPSGLWRCGGME